MRHPDQIMEDFHKAVRGQGDVDPMDVLWEIIEDICDSFTLAIRDEFPGKQNASSIDIIMGTVGDYVANYYGED